MFGTVSPDDNYTGTKAAAFGGTTTIIDIVSFDFPTLSESVDKRQVKAEKAAVDKKGTEAAAATVVIVPAGMPEGVVLTIDRPFFYVIRDIPSGTILFMGRVVDPR